MEANIPVVTFLMGLLSDQASGGEVAGDVDLPFEKIK